MTVPAMKAKTRIDNMILPTAAKWNPRDAFQRARQEVAGDGWVGYVMQEANDPSFTPPDHTPHHGPWTPKPCDHCGKPFTRGEMVAVEVCPRTLPVKSDLFHWAHPHWWSPSLYWHSDCYYIAHPYRLEKRGRMSEKHVTSKAKRVKKKISRPN